MCGGHVADASMLLVAVGLIGAASSSSLSGSPEEELPLVDGPETPLPDHLKACKAPLMAALYSFVQPTPDRAAGRSRPHELRVTAQRLAHRFSLPEFALARHLANRARRVAQWNGLALAAGALLLLRSAKALPRAP